MSGLTGQEKFRAVEGLEVTPIPDGYVIYDEPRDQVHYLNPTAAVIYTVLDGERTVGQIGAFLRDVYGIGEAPDLAEIFSTFEKAGLVCRAG